MKPGSESRWLCLEEYEDGGNRCDVQCLGCSNVEEREANGKPPPDTCAPSETAASKDVLAERQRQKEKEGWTEGHDDGHDQADLAVAGACYALHAASTITACLDNWRVDFGLQAKNLWPWGDEWFKPKDARRDLVRAAALILAEIERIDRSAND